MFVNKYYDKLMTTWHVINEEAGFNELKFRNCTIFPLISDGWDDLIENNGLPENAEIIFSYYGKTIFAIAGFKELDDPHTYPKFHSRSLDPKDTFFFDVPVLSYQLIQPMMVIILNSFIN
jgi:hypothetical protein